MKLLAIILIGVLVVSQETTSQEISSLVQQNGVLFDTAWDYQGKLTGLQNDIDQKLFDIRTAVSSVLRGSTNLTLTQVENNAVDILKLDETVRNVLTRLLPDGCIEDLVEILDGLTHMSGFESSNCLKHYDNSVQSELAKSNDILKAYDQFANEVQQMVVQAFIGKNAFKDPNAIIEKIVNTYKRLNDDWEATRPNIDSVVNNLKTAIGGFNNQLGQCFNSMQLEYAESYTKVNDKKAVCEEFGRSARSISGNRFSIEEFLPSAK